MKDIDELVKNIKKYNKATVQKKLKSKKNTVAYVTIKGKPRILKWFVPGLSKQMENEYKVLKKGAAKLNIPTVYEIDKKNNVLTTNYIMGENLCDIINSSNTTKNEKQRLMMLLADWFFEFHKYFKGENQFIIRGDPTLRNFILTDRIWGVDFEESRPGKTVEDISGMCVSILTTDPMFTAEKFELCNLFLKSYAEKAPSRLVNINEEISYALLEKIQFRPDDEELLRKQSKKIKENGVIH